VFFAIASVLTKTTLHNAFLGAPPSFGSHGQRGLRTRGESLDTRGRWSATNHANCEAGSIFETGQFYRKNYG
jgi:hypothetical protein